MAHIFGRTRDQFQPPPSPTPLSWPFMSASEITRTECRQCGTEIYGVNGRYSCAVCGWVNPWYEGHGELPTAEDDPDRKGGR
ncbi:predicted protein [Streptomyces albidoflavus]|nr:predicted protein [Streptomyces albidoflavus]